MDIVHTLFRTGLQPSTLEYGFTQACANNHVPLVDFLLHCGRDDFELQSGFVQACVDGNLELARFIWDQASVKIDKTQAQTRVMTVGTKLNAFWEEETAHIRNTGLTRNFQKLQEWIAGLNGVLEFLRSLP